VFISYASADRLYADAIVDMLEESGVPCWIAARDIPPGASWPNAIADAVARCGLVLLVFSEASDQSREVLHELALADRDSKAVLPVRIRNEPSKGTAFFVTSVQWFDAWEQPISTYKEALVAAVQGKVREAGTERTMPVRVPPRPDPAWRQRIHQWMRRSAGVAVIAILLTLLLQLFFYATGTALLRGVSFWLVLMVSGLVAWVVKFLWSSLKEPS